MSHFHQDQADRGKERGEMTKREQHWPSLYPGNRTVPIRYLIVSRDERDDNGGPLYWSNRDGWVSRQDATRFTEDERRAARLPFGRCGWTTD